MSQPRERLSRSPHEKNDARLGAPPPLLLPRDAPPPPPPRHSRRTGRTSPTSASFARALQSGKSSSAGARTCESGDGSCSRSRAKTLRSWPFSDAPKPRTKMPRLLFALALLATACASHSRPATPAPGTPPTAPPPPPPPAPPAAPPRASSEVVRLGPSALRYVSHQVVHIDQEFQGMRQPSDFGLRSFFRVTIAGPADSAGYATTVTVDSIVPDSGS